MGEFHGVLVTVFAAAGQSSAWNNGRMSAGFILVPFPA
jgi:hypothetical protein